jgi:hypothetical protein
MVAQKKWKELGTIMVSSIMPHKISQLGLKISGMLKKNGAKTCPSYQLLLATAIMYWHYCMDLRSKEIFL